MEVLRERARLAQATVVLPEGEDPRIREAALLLEAKGWARPVLLGKRESVSLPPGSSIEVIDPREEDLTPFATAYASRREGVNEKTARRLIKRPLFFGAMMVAEGQADAMVAGAANSTTQVIAAAALAVGYAEGVSSPSSFFLMEWPKSSLVFADAAVAVEPTAEELAGIAVMTACHAGILLGIEPRVALLAADSRGSADRSAVSARVAEAVGRAREMAKGVAIDGPLNVGAALATRGAASVLPDSPLQEPANVLIFPDLDAANTGYKLAQYLGGGRAIGPILQGFDKTICDLSRGASVEDIVDVVTIAAVQA